MKEMSDRIAALTPEQRAVFELLRKKSAPKKPAPAVAPPIPRRAGAGPAPLSFDQERLWFLGQLDPDSAAYNIDTAIRMKGRLDIPVLQAVLSEIVRRHEAWRTVFPAVDGRPVQVALPPRPVELPVVDLSELPPAEREARVLEVAGEEARTPMDLAQGPLVRIRLLRLSADEHICLMTVHHIVSDWYSFNLAWMEIAALYPAFLAGRPSPLPEPPVQYADFALWQRSWLAGEVLENALDFWTKELEGYPHVLELPTDRPRPAAQTTRGSRAKIALPPARAEGFRALARREGVTLFMAALAGFDALLARWSGQEKIVVGSPNANRNRPEIERLLGFFVSQLVFATDVSGNPTFREILGRARKTALGAYAHQELPFGKLVEALSPERDASRAPLAQVNLLVLDTASFTVELPSLTFSGVDVDDGSSLFDTTLSLFDHGASGIHGWFEYNVDLWEAATMERLAQAFEGMVERTSADPAIPLSEIPLLPEGAVHQVLSEWNDTGAAGDLRPVHLLFEERAAESPGAVALVVADRVFSDLEVTWGELDRAANRLAHRLRRLGVGKESRVGLMTGRGPELLVGLLGIWKAGGAYVPLDPGYPPERLAFLVEDAGIEVAVTEPELSGLLPERVRTVALDGVASLAGEPEERPEDPAQPGDLAYVIYTSGTTGKPKGVMVEHGNLASTILASRIAFGWGRGDRIPVLAPFSFDIFLFEVMSPLTAGGTVELVPLSPALDLDRLMTALGTATRLHAVPALMRQISALVPSGTGLKTLFVGGDAVPSDLLAEMREAFPGAGIRVLYGPTEGTIICSSWAVPEDGGGAGRAMLGRPLPNVDLRIYGRQGGLALPGAPGELWIGGPGVTRGYLNRPDLTADKFVTRDGRRWYRTGDLARLLPDGSLEFAGRVDQQVKVRGFRVEPGEIEARLAAHPAVREAVVLAVEVAGGDKRLAAYVVPEGEVAEEVLRSWVGEALPEYMVPGLFVTLPELPVTAHGKVDKKALLALGTAEPAPAPADRAAPRTPAEEILARIWRGVLGVDEVSVHDNFFRLGGDSILSIQVVARARQEGLLLTPRQMFESQTIAALAAVAVPAVQEEEQGPVEGEAPLTPIQLRFFAEDRPEPGWFDQALLFEAREALDPARLKKAVAALVEHHDALRLRFVREEGGWRQVHAPVGEVPFFTEELPAGFDLETGPLFRAVLLGTERLLLAAHHLVVDGVSWRILLEDLATAYAGHPLPAKTTSWKRWAERLADHAHSEAVRGELGFWRGQTLPEPLPVDREEGPNTVGSAATVSLSLDAETTDALLKRAPAAYRTEINDLLLAALARTLAAWTGAGRHRIELEGHGREEVVPGVDLSRTVGWFTTVFPVVLPVHGGPGEAIRAVKEKLRAVPHRGIGYGLLRYLSPEGESLACLPDPEVGFNYLGRVDGAVPGALVPSDEPTGPAESPEALRRHLLDVDALVHGGALRVTFTYSRSRHDEATVERLARAFLAEIEALVAHCLSPEAGGYTPSDFPLARLDQAAIDSVLGRDRSVEDVYPLAPLQRGMLFHTLYAPGSEIYFEQLSVAFEGALDVAAFGRAFQEVTDRQPVLRTAFVWEGLPEPLQVVRRGVAMPWVLEDWRHVPADEVDERFAAYAAADRARGFDPGRPPLQRAALVRTGEDSYRLLWSFHHILFDGWCFSPLFGEIFTLYEAHRRGTAPDLPPVHPYRAYVEWLSRRDLGAAEAWWRARLEGFSAATPLPLTESGEGRAARDFADRSVTLPAPLLSSLQAFAQAEGLTLNTLMQGAWALLLSRLSGERDVVFGAVAAGRPADLPGVESMVGLFINTLPVRVEIRPEAPVADWLRDLQARQAEMRSWEWSPLVDVQRWSGVPPGRPLFHSLLVFENYPIDPGLGGAIPDLTFGASHLSEQTNYPLTLAFALRGGDFDVRASFDGRLEAETAERLLRHLEALLAALAADSRRAVGDLPVLPDLAVVPRSAPAEWVPEGVALPPRTPVEEALARVWRAVLRLDRVGREDDFFRLGGDSILSLQIVVKAREEGLRVTPKQIFEHPTIAALAALAAVATPLGETGEEDGPAEGEAPLTPIQRSFLEADGPDLHWFNQVLLLEIRERTAPEVLARAVDALSAAHGALRLRFRRDGGEWRSAVAPVEGRAPFLRVDLTALPVEMRSQAVETASADLQTGFDLARGPLFLAAFLDPGRLFLAAHHLVVDSVSWQILLSDLETACRQVRLPEPTLSWRRWAERLAAYAGSEEILAERPFWLAAPAAPALPVDFPGGENPEASAASVSVTFPPAATAALLREAPRAYRARVDDLLLTALVRAFARWTGAPRLRLDLEAHGREEIFPGTDLSRTAGWFTAVYPVTLDVSGAPGLKGALLAVKEQLRAVPRRGIGWGLLRPAGLPAPEVLFNNLGQLDQAFSEAGRFAPAPEPTGPSRSPRAPRGHLLEVSALVLDGRLHVGFGYGSRLHREETIRRLSEDFREELEALLAHCLSPEAGGYSPSDFPLARLGQAALDAALGGDRAVEDLYPLAPLQRGMLFHGLLAPQSTFYLEQISCDLVGGLDVPAFTRAWQRVVDRHPALRTAFLWQEVDEPLQAVRRGVEMPWTVEDWRGEPEERLRAFLAEDFARVFDLSRAPLMRAALLRTEDDRHRFVWSFHHLLFDGWCFSLILREVFLFYEAFQSGSDLDLPRPRPYRDYIAWLAGRDPAEAEAFWRRTLAGFAAATPIPLDVLGGAPENPEPKDEMARIPAGPAAALEAFVQGRRLTVNTLVQAAWGLLLSRYSGEPDVVFGTVVSGRPPELPGVESMVGLFINTQPVRIVAEPHLRVGSWLPRVQEDQVEMRQHGWSPLADVQGWSELPPGKPLFHSLLAFENFPLGEDLEEGGGGLEVTGFFFADRSDYPLSFSVTPSTAGLALRLTHDHRVEKATAQRLLGSFVTLLEGLAADPGRRLDEVPILSEAERGQLLAWSAGEEPAGGAACLHEIFAAQAQRTPDALALVDDGGETTYAELDRRANRLANTLRRLGVGPEVRVGLSVPRNAEMVTAVLGILKAGGAYVPVDPETPPDRLAYLFEDAAAPVVITEAFLNDPSWLDAPDTAPVSGVTPENLAYVIYTSGSTGLPKGVMVRHRSAAGYARSMTAVYGIGPGDRAVQFASVSFDASVEEIFTALGSGATLFIRTGVDDVSVFLERCRAWRLTHLSVPTAYWHQIAAALESEGTDLPPDLRFVVMGGEKALPERWGAWGRGAGARVRLVNAYGPTEATIAATIHEHPRTASAFPRREVPIGRPLPGVAAHVLGRDLRLVPVGGTGELCLGGECLARGYLGRPELTAEQFVPDPFGPPGSRLYRTGDLVRRLPDGTLEFAGRADAQVKVRGFRIELGEVEAALSAHPGVKEAAATTREDASGSHRLVAFAVPKVPGDPLADLRAFLAGRLPAYMVPSDLGVLDALPVTPAGKLDRQALDAVQVARGAGAGYVAPRNPVEETLAAIWEELLGVDRVGVDDDFFTLGGHSLLATQLVSRVRRQLGVDLPLHRLFELRTLSDLAREVLAKKLEAEGGGLDALLADLDGLSDEEALALLEEEGA